MDGEHCENRVKAKTGAKVLRNCNFAWVLSESIIFVFCPRESIAEGERKRGSTRFALALLLFHLISRQQFKQTKSEPKGNPNM